MRLLIAYPNPFSYSETFIHNHIKYLKPSFTLVGGWLPYIDQNKKSIFIFPFSIDFLRGILRKVSPILYKKLYTFCLKRFLLKNNIDRVLAEYGITGCNVLEACKGTNTPLIVHYHGFDAYEYRTIDQYSNSYKELFKYCKKIIVVSEDMKQALLKIGATETQLINHPYGVDLNNFIQTAPAKNDPILISVGRFTGKKAPQLSIKAFQRVSEQNKEARLWMVGNGELFEECKQLIKDLRLENKIVLWGVKTPDEIATLLKQAKIFIQHSLRPANGDSEGTPNTILEASAVGLAIVSTKHAGIKEAVIHGETGYLVDEGDYLKMSDYMLTLLNDNLLLEQMGKKARKHMEENYSMHKQIAKLQTILEQNVDTNN